MSREAFSLAAEVIAEHPHEQVEYCNLTLRPVRSRQLTRREEEDELVTVEHYPHVAKMQGLCFLQVSIHQCYCIVIEVLINDVVGAGECLAARCGQRITSHRRAFLLAGVQCSQVGNKLSKKQSSHIYLLIQSSSWHTTPTHCYFYDLHCIPYRTCDSFYILASLFPGHPALTTWLEVFTLSSCTFQTISFSHTQTFASLLL